ncbi:hypothetical protein E2C01_001301 [Portunus trituberculatus]|uniref:Uncharacterized protein n=1 Tax=Portunus trituberculatus TaxID=210409 RepID=A0A5B7CGT8_PORTR|nr:hypothetical protein [Portunus trituberculatus]
MLQYSYRNVCTTPDEIPRLYRAPAGQAEVCQRGVTNSDITVKFISLLIHFMRRHDRCPARHTSLSACLCGCLLYAD